MSAFILAKNGKEMLIDRALKAFRYREFKNEIIIPLSTATLLLYNKDLIDEKNYIRKNNYFISAIGTLIYYGKSFSESLELLFFDMIEHKIDYEELIGNFVVIFDDGKRISILCDNNNMYKLFSDSENNYISSSFMVSAYCSGKGLNHNAAIEQLLCGFISSPDTLAEGVYEISYNTNKRDYDWFFFQEMRQDTNTSENVVSKKKSINEQVRCISKFFDRCRNICNEYGAEAGLSGGFDSRLIYSATHSCGITLKSVHTHNTDGIHKKEIVSVEELVKVFSTPLIKIPTCYLPFTDNENIDNVLHENVVYYDGRNAETIGAMSETHTRKYKTEACNGNYVTFSGVGGEIYRDFYYTKVPIVFPKLWLEVHAFNLDLLDVISPNAYNTAVDKIIKKIECEMNRSIRPFAGKDFPGLYFAKHRIINDLSNVINANNQLSFFIAPFTDKRVVNTSFSGEKWHDQCGEYEGKIISSFSKAVVGIITSKGYPMNRIPKRVKARWAIRSYCPRIIWKIRKKREKSNSNLCIDSIKQKSNYFDAALKTVFNYFPEINAERLLCCRINNSLVFSICSIYETYKLIYEGVPYIDTFGTM